MRHIAPVCPPVVVTMQEGRFSTLKRRVAPWCCIA